VWKADTPLVAGLELVALFEVGRIEHLFVTLVTRKRRSTSK